MVLSASMEPTTAVEVVGEEDGRCTTSPPRAFHSGLLIWFNDSCADMFVAGLVAQVGPVPVVLPEARQVQAL